MDAPAGFRTRVLALYQSHETAWDMAFFTAGFVFDIAATRHGVDHPLMILQQVIYLGFIGAVLCIEAVREVRAGQQFSPRLERLWSYRSPVTHFCLGTLMNIYSIFFLMSASWFSSMAFVVLLFGAIALNEMKAVRRRGIDVKVGLYIVCLFCFWSLMFPLALGFVGRVTFLLALVATVGTLAAFRLALVRRLPRAEVDRRLFLPGISVCAGILLLYFAGLIPPVPIAARKLGVYHFVERVDDAFVLSRERPTWKFWQSGDQTFRAQPGDAIYVFVAIFSPSRIRDTVFVHWFFHDPAKGWEASDRIPIAITGGREGGFRGYANKQNYTYGKWRVSVETGDGREIARLYIQVVAAEADPGRVLVREIY